MSADPARLIRRWFAKHDGDGEFQAGVRSYPHSLIGPPRLGGRILLTTKPAPVSAIIRECGAPADLGMIGRYGLTDEADLVWIRKLIGRSRVFFLGDKNCAAHWPGAIELRERLKALIRNSFDHAAHYASREFTPDDRR